MVSVPSKIGKYEILSEVGRGGMGVVYRARDPILDRVVALKTMFVNVLQEEGMRERFLREARSAARLQHHNIVTVYEFGEVEGAPFIAMEFLEGEDLVDAVDHGRFPDLASKLRVMVQLCDGLHFAHCNGVIHRDVKPSNVTLLPNGSIKVVDFGIARVEGGTMATRTGTVLGTPSYMAPEQFAGEVADHRTDQWAAGVILYELVAGRRPFTAATVHSLIYKIINAPVPPVDPGVAQIPVALWGVIERALNKDATARFADMEAMGQALRQVLASVVDGTAALAPARQPLPGGPRPPAVGSTSPTSQLPGPVAMMDTSPTMMRPPATPIPRRQGFLEDGSFGEVRKVQVILLSPDETFLVAGGTDGSIRLWDLATRTKVATFRNRMHMRTGHGSVTTALAFSRDGSLLASGHLDGAIYVWEIGSELELDVKLGHDGAVGGLALAPDGATMISGGADQSIKWWDLKAARARDARRILRRQPDAVLCMELARHGRVVVTGHTNRSLRVHDNTDQRLVATLHGHHSPLAVLATSPESDLVASGARDGVVRVHHLETREQRAVYQEHSRTVAGLAFFPGGQRLASVAMDNSLVVFDINEPELPTSLLGEAEDAFASVAVTRDGKRIFAATAEGRFRVWQAL